MKRRNKGLRTLAGIAVAAVLWMTFGIAGLCSAQEGKTVVIASASDLFRIANPAVFRLSSLNYWWHQVFSGLTRVDENFRPVPDLAESWTVSEDGRTFTFNLRRGVKWHDGQPFSAEDVKFTYETLLHKDNRAGASHFNYFGYIEGAPEYRAGKADSVKGVEVLDPHKVRIRLREPYAAFLTVSAIQPIVPKHVLGNVPLKGMMKHSFTHKPIGTGPYRFESWKSRDRAVLRVNPDYFGKKPKIARIIWRTMPDTFSRLAALRKKEINVNGLYAAVPVDEFENLDKDPCCKAVRMVGQSNWFLDFNLKNPIFQDVRVRRAISYAIDRKAILKHVFKGWGSIVNSPFHPLSWAYKKDVTLYDGDPQKAKQLLEEAGWKVGPDGVRVKDGKRLSFTWRVGIGRAAAIMAEAAVPMLKAAGVEAKLERLAFVTLWFKHYVKKNYDALSHLHPNSVYSDPDYDLLRWYDHRINKTGYNNPKVERLIKKAARILDRKRRKEIYDELQEILAQDAVRVWLIHTDELWGVSKDLVMPDLPTGFRRILAIQNWDWKK
ncbi:MAG: ABC transporter substrate-binding protein [Nitrospinota bacterium]